MKNHFVLAALFSLALTTAKSQVVYTPGTYYVIPPTSGCNGVWAIQNIPGCSLVALHPCWSYGYVNGDTLFLNLCSLPCYYESMTMTGDMCPVQICEYAPYTPPTAGFIANDSTLCAGDSIQIVNTSSNAVSYQWSVPGALPSSSAEVNPYFQFPVSGTYDMTLVATNPDGATDTTTEIITVNIETLPVALFDANPIVSLADPTVAFSNNSTGATTFSWDFGDGTFSTDFEPVHTFNSAGIYTVTLVASNGTCPNDTAWMDIQVVDDLGSADYPAPVFLLYPNPVKGQLTVIWTANMKEEAVDISICDLHGRSILKQIGVDTREPFQIDLSQYNIPTGVYFFTVNTTETAVIRRLMIY